MTNSSLLVLSKCVLELNRINKPLSDGAKIPASVPYKEFMLTKVFLRPCFNGRSYAVFNFCISQHEQNSGETWCSMEFANKVKELKSIIKQAPAKKTAQAIADKEAEIKKAEKALEQAKKDGQPASEQKAQSDIKSAKFYIEIFQQFV